MLKKLLSGVFTFALLLSMIPQVEASATTSNPSTDDAFYSDTTKITLLTAAESSQYECYEAHLPNDSVNAQATQLTTVTKAILLAHCTLTSSYFSGSTPISIFTSDTIASFLYNCATVTEISTINDHLYISYVTDNDVEVTLCYHESGLHDKVIYFPESDTAIIDDGTSITKVEGFRTGCSYEATDEQMQAAYASLQAGSSSVDSAIMDPDDLLNAPAISADFSPLATGFTNEASMLTNLRIAFPPQDAQVLYANSLYSSYLQDNFSVTVRQTRNAYVKKSVDSRSFAVSTALTVIGVFLGVPTNVATAIVAGLGIVISAADTILQAVTLYRSAVYRFYAARDGYVYDKITQNANVHVVYHSSYGEFTGGYASDGSFTWVISSYPDAFNQDATTIANEALRLYGIEVFANGYNSRYYPD